jgi:hypothetical protein
MSMVLSGAMTNVKRMFEAIKLSKVFQTDSAPVRE